MPRDLKLTPTTSRISRWGWPHGGVSLDDALEVLCGVSLIRTVYVVGIDQATLSGWAVADPIGGKVLLRGTTRSTNDQLAALERMRGLPAFDWSRVLVVFEDHGIRIDPDRSRWTPERGAPDRSSTQREAVTLGDARGGWRVLLDLRNHPASQRLLAQPSEWRKVYAGLRMPGDTQNDACMRWASALVGHRVDQPDEADAMGLSVWGSVTGLHAFASERLRRRAADRASRAAANASRARTTDGEGST
jgi:hypothetical protein